MFPLKRKLFHRYTCTAVANAQQDSPPNNLCEEEFRYKGVGQTLCQTIGPDTTVGSQGGSRGIVHIGLKSNNTIVNSLCFISSGSFFIHTLVPPLPMLNGTRRLTNFVRKTFDTRSQSNPRRTIDSDTTIGSQVDSREIIQIGLKSIHTSELNTTL
ncbi:hypothetical protein A2U01_0002919 [Trifolium medium]|uniref:Uncharacterized protein n=1 Tax=Trifolium medium TaxID=97028 RepID=A0A392M402_9FABA|nr:hypothetical protein [Trifolium medium]